VEGRNAVRELLVAGRRPVRDVWLAHGVAGDELADLVDLARDAGARIHLVEPDALAARARTDAPQGVVARAAPVAPADPTELLRAADAFLLALDGVTDPGNLGAVLRAADTAGVTGVIVPRHRAAHLTPAAVKAAAGAVEHVLVASVSGIPSFLERARREGVWTVGLDADGDASVFDLPVATDRVVVVLGAEGSGLARLTRDRCDVVARIPLHGALESLNVASAAAVAAHALAHQRTAGSSVNSGRYSDQSIRKNQPGPGGGRR
jgi:23S rRNA (guanosine2251-2'-O)-methyltransferase